MSMVFLTKRLSYMCTAFFIGAAIIGVLVKAATTIPTLPPAFTIGSIIQVTTITIHHNLGPRGDFWVTTDESSPLPPPRVSAKSTQEMLDSHRVQRKYWLYRPHADGPDFLRGDSFVDDGPIGTAKSADILLEATMPDEGTIVNVECLDDGTYRAGLWVNEKLGGWKFLGSDSEVLIQGENSLPLRTATITGSLDKKDLTITLKGTKDTRRFRFRSDAGRWYELTSSTTRPAP